MANEPRKATEVLLELEAKIDNLTNLVKAQAFANQLLSNKVTELMDKLNKQQVAAPKVVVEAVKTLPQTPLSPVHSFVPGDPERQIPIMAEVKLPETGEPKGFRRTSRPEGYAGDDIYLGNQVLPTQPKYPVQTLKPPPGRGPGAEVVVPPQAQQKQTSKQVPPPPPQAPAKQPVVQNAVPVVQRVVNGDGKSIFLADVEVTDMSTSQPVAKTRTNGTGKWMASLGAGAYRVTIRKKGTANVAAMEAIQDIQVTGQESPLTLQTIIVK